MTWLLRLVPVVTLSLVVSSASPAPLASAQVQQTTPSLDTSSTRVVAGEVIELTLSGCPPPGWDAAYAWTAIVSGGTEGSAGAFEVQDPTGATPNTPLVFLDVGVPGPHGFTRHTMSAAGGGTHVVSFPISPGASSGYFFVECFSEAGVDAGRYRMTSAFVEVIPSSDAAVPRSRAPSFTG